MKWNKNQLMSLTKVITIIQADYNVVKNRALYYSLTRNI